MKEENDDREHKEDFKGTKKKCLRGKGGERKRKTTDRGIQKVQTIESGRDRYDDIFRVVNNYHLLGSCFLRQMMDRWMDG